MAERAAQSGFEDVIQGMPTEFLECRVNGSHQYRLITKQWISEERAYWVVRRCRNCKTAERTWWLDKDGYILTASTRYIPLPNKPGYVFKEIGRPTRASNAAMRLELVQNRWETTP